MAADIRKLKDKAAQASARGKHKKALELYRDLAALEPKDGSWPRRVGEMHRQLGQSGDAVDAFARSCEAYAAAGFLVKAVAVCKLILRIDPDHRGAQERLVALQAERGFATTAPGETRDDPVAAQPIEAGAALESVELSRVIPGSVALPDPSGAASGIHEIPIDLELDDDPDDAGAPRSAEIREALVETPLFSALPRESLGRLIDEVRLVELPAGQVLFHAGDVGDALYVVADGEVDVHSPGPPHTLLSKLGEGAFFGEVGLVTAQPRSATVVAARDTELLAIDRAVMSGLIREEPEVLRVLLRFLRDRLLDTLVATSSLFAPFAGEEQAALAQRFAFLEVEAGTRLIRQGEPADGLYVALCGKLSVLRDQDGRTSELAELGPGDVFGEMSLLARSGAVASVEAGKKTLALRMAAEDFQEVIMTHPQVLMFVSELAAEREKKLAAVSAGSAEYEELHLDLL